MWLKLFHVERKEEVVDLCQRRVEKSKMKGWQKWLRGQRIHHGSKVGCYPAVWQHYDRNSRTSEGLVTIDYSTDLHQTLSFHLKRNIQKHTFKCWPLLWIVVPALLHHLNYLWRCVTRNMVLCWSVPFSDALAYLVFTPGIWARKCRNIYGNRIHLVWRT